MTLYILYNEKKLSAAYGTDFKTKMQDSIAMSNKNCLFTDVSAGRSKTRQYVIREMTQYDSIVLIGNNSIMPFEKLPSPVSDGDGLMETDNYWATMMKEMTIPDYPVARIPDGEDDSRTGFLRRIENTMRQTQIQAVEKTGITADIWALTARKVFSGINGMGEMKNSPPHNAKAGKIKYSRFNGAMYYNLHGSKELPGWYGQRKRSDYAGEEFPLAIMPESFKEGCAGGYVLSEACFGGYVTGKKLKKSIVLTALNSSVPFVIASTATAYGTFRPPLGEADLFAEIFYAKLRKHRIAGMAFLRAKRQFAADMISKYGFLDDDDRKTLLEFTFYGNPLTEVIYE